MKKLKHVFFKALTQLRRKAPALERFRRPYRSIRVPDLPDDLKSNYVYLVGENDHLWSAALKCPGGCGQILEINLVSDMRPLWRVAENREGIVTIEPSIWRKRDCGCHFRIIDGRIIWY